MGVIKKVEEVLFFNFFIRSFVSGYLVWAVGSYKNLKAIQLDTIAN